MNKFKKNILLFVAHSNFLQKIASIIVLIIPQILTHNIEKYKIIKNIFYTLDMDDVKGDYLEFGCFTGSSLKHAINCYKKIFTKNKNQLFSGGYKILADLIYSSKDSLKIKDVPIRFYRRISGKSKMSFSILIILIYFIFTRYINKIVNH